MATEITVHEALKNTIASEINSYITEIDTLGIVGEIKDKNIHIAFPDAMKISLDEEIYIFPNNANIENKTFCSDLFIENLDVYILTKQDNDERLLYKATVIENALIKTLQRNRNLGGEVLTLEVTDTTTYPSVSPSQTITCIKVQMNITFMKSY